MDGPKEKVIVASLGHLFNRSLLDTILTYEREEKLEYQHLQAHLKQIREITKEWWDSDRYQQLRRLNRAHAGRMFRQQHKDFDQQYPKMMLMILRERPDEVMLQEFEKKRIEAIQKKLSRKEGLETFAIPDARRYFQPKWLKPDITPLK